MKLWLSDKAQKQLCEQSAKKTEVDPAKARRDEERHQQRQVKSQIKAFKVRARENAKQADIKLQIQLDVIQAVDADIEVAETRMARDRTDYDQRCDRKIAELTSLQRELERVHEKMEQARMDLEKTRNDVPKSISGMEKLHQQRAKNVVTLRNGFQTNEDAWKAEHLSNSYKGKRNTGLRRIVKGIIEA